jgi:uncharacterized membrane protein YphA (DoxX/SURF4 family)
MTPLELRAIRWTLALVWIATGFIVLGIYPEHDSLHLLERLNLTGTPAQVTLYGGALLDLALGVLTLFGRGRWLWRVQAGLILFYMLLIAIWLPEFWIHPFGPLLKNFPILLLLWLLHRHEQAA